MSGTVPNEAPLQHTPSSLSLLDEQILSQEPSSLAQQHPSVCVELGPPQPFNCSDGWGAFKGEGSGYDVSYGTGGNFLLTAWADAALGEYSQCVWDLW